MALELGLQFTVLHLTHFLATACKLEYFAGVALSPETLQNCHMGCCMQGERLLGMGSGQPNRVKSTQIALEKAADELAGAVLASDAFFPFAWGDSV